MAFEVWAPCPRCKSRNLLQFLLVPDTLKCTACGSVILQYEPVRGYLYVLSNESMPGLVKIGHSTRPVRERVAELNSATGVPSQFVIEAIFPSADPARHECEVHELLSSSRLPNREFFRETVANAVLTIRNVCNERPSFLKDPRLYSERRPREESRSPEEMSARLRAWQERASRR